MMQLAAVLIATAAAGVALGTLARPHWAFVLLMVMFPLKQLLQVYVPFISRNPIYVNYAIGGLVLAAIVTRFTRREQVGASFWNPVSALVLALYALWFIGILYSPAQTAVIERLNTDATYIILLLVFMPLLVLDIYEFRRALYALMVVGAIICVLIMINPHSSYYSGRLVLDLGMTESGRDRGSALATAELGAMTALVAALIRPAGGTFLVTAARIAAFIAGMGMAIGSGSRGQVLAVSIVGIMFFPLSRKLANPKQFFLVTIGFIVLVGGLYGVFKLFVHPENIDRWDPFGMLRDTTMRLEMVRDLFDYYLSSPAHWLFGLGTGAYAAISVERTVSRDYVHNVAAEVLCEHGIVGFIFFLAMIVLLIKMARQLWMQYRDDPPMRATVALLCGICVFTLLEALKQGAMHFPSPFFWWLILAKLAKEEVRVMALAGHEAPTDHDGIVEEPVEYGDDAGRAAPGYAVGP